MTIRAYLRASTKQQNAQRAKQSLQDFMAGFNKDIDVWYIENESGTKLDRPELNRLLDDSNKGDILLLEDIDRLTRLKPQDFEILAKRIEDKGIELVIVSLPLTFDILKDTEKSPLDDITRAVMRGMKRMMIEVLATVSRHDYDKRRERQRQGIDSVMSDPKAKAKKYTGKQANTDQYKTILEFRKIGKSYSQIEKLLGVTRVTISRAIKWGESQVNQSKPVKSKATKKPVNDTPILPPVEPVAEPKPIKAPKTTKQAKTPKNATIEPVKCDKTPDMFEHDWRVQGLTDSQIDKIRANVYEFGDYNFELLPHIPNYLEKFNHWENDLKDPSKLGQFKGIDEILNK